MKTLNKQNQHELNINIDSLPEWANYIAMDRNGEWFAYEKKPVLRRHLNDWWNPEQGGVRIIKLSYKCKNWEESLYKIERIMEKHKWYNEIVAFAEGKEIEVRRINCFYREWRVTENPPFTSDNFEFRVKKEPKYIPFTFEDRDVFRGKWVVDKESGLEMIVDRLTAYRVNGYTFDKALEVLEFLDGTPFGKLEGGSDE